jgi:DnaK suppressor protein
MPLNKKELEKFKERLIELRRQITHSIQGTKEEVKELDQSKGYSQHQADEGTDDFGRTVSLELSNKELYILKQIDRALEKITDGTYGICDVSGEEIARARLEAIPYAVMTVKAQEQMEKGAVE